MKLTLISLTGAAIAGARSLHDRDHVASAGKPSALLVRAGVDTHHSVPRQGCSHPSEYACTQRRAGFRVAKRHRSVGCRFRLLRRHRVWQPGESGDQVNFNLDATNSCTGQVDHFTGTDTVQNGQIVGANVVQTGQ
jgi:hypothetical protein